MRSSIPCISSLLVVTFLSISASAALYLLCFGGPLDLLGSELGHAMFLSRVKCVLDVYLVKGSPYSTCCGISLIFSSVLLCWKHIVYHDVRSKWAFFSTQSHPLPFSLLSALFFPGFSHSNFTLLILLYTLNYFSTDSLNDYSVLLPPPALLPLFPVF